MKPYYFRVPKSEGPSHDGPRQAEAEGDPDGQGEDGRELQGAGKDPGKTRNKANTHLPCFSAGDGDDPEAGQEAGHEERDKRHKGEGE